MTLTETDVIYACHVTVEFLIGSLESLNNNLELICALEEEQTIQPDECYNQSMLAVTLAITKSLLKNEVVLLSDARHAHTLDLSQCYLNTHEAPTLQP